jgi:EAL domain-containing protein (putative c-di-GMP-specific phosphodiesterase class I)
MGEPLGKPLSVAQLMELFAEVARAAARRGAAPKVATGGAAFEPGIEVDDLRRGLAAGELFVVFQPILDLETLAPVGAEALARWRHPVHGLVPPLRFVPLVESSGLAAEMTEQIFGLALAFAGAAGYRWGERPLSISINVATAALAERDLVALVSARLAASGLAPGRLVVEVTETAMNAERSRVLEVLSRLRLRGVEVSIDDFGTGASSLERLDQFPCTELKIERAFVSDLLRRPGTEAIVRSTIELARRLGLRIVAEGIEDAATWRWLRAAGCETGQGYLFSRGVEPDEFLAWLAAWEPRRRALLDAAAS